MYNNRLKINLAWFELCRNIDSIKHNELTFKLLHVICVRLIISSRRAIPRTISIVDRKTFNSVQKKGTNVRQINLLCGLKTQRRQSKQFKKVHFKNVVVHLHWKKKPVKTLTNLQPRRPSRVQWNDVFFICDAIYITKFIYPGWGVVVILTIDWDDSTNSDICT